VLQADFIWKNLIKELQLNNLGEPYWFCTNSSDLIEKWLDEILNSNENELQIIQVDFSINRTDNKTIFFEENCSCDSIVSQTGIHRFTFTIFGFISILYSNSMFILSKVSSRSIDLSHLRNNLFSKML